MRYEGTGVYEVYCADGTTLDVPLWQVMRRTVGSRLRKINLLRGMILPRPEFTGTREEATERSGYPNPLPKDIDAYRPVSQQRGVYPSPLVPTLDPENESQRVRPRCEHSVMLGLPCSVCNPVILSSTKNVIPWNSKALTETTVDHISVSNDDVRPKRRVKDRAWTGAAASPWVRSWSAPDKSQSRVKQPTGQLILVPPTPMHIPYGIVTNCENDYRNHIEQVAEYNFGTMANLSGGRALDKALNARRTNNSLDKNFSKGSQENNWSDDDIVSEVATPVSLGYEHSPTGKVQDFKTLPSATMHGYVDHGSEFWETLRLSELECCAAEEFVERVLLREFLEFYDNASKADDNMSDRKIAASIRAAWKYTRRWDFPALRHPATIFFPTVPRSDYFRDEITKYLRRITTDQVRRLREKWQQMRTDEARKNTKAQWDATRKAMKANRRLIEALKSGAENDSKSILSIT